MKRFIQGKHRGQSTLLPESLDDYVSDINSSQGHTRYQMWGDSEPF